MNFVPRRPVRTVGCRSQHIATGLVDATENGFIMMHAATGLPWWACIVGTTVLLRLSLSLPLGVHQQRVLARLENLKPTLVEWRMALEHKCVVQGRRANLPLDTVQANYQLEFASVRNQLLREHKCAPWRASLPIYAHVPVWIILSLGLRQLCGSPVVHAELSRESFLWMSDLTLPLSLPSVLPIFLGAAGLLTIEVHSLRVLASGIAPSQTQVLLTRIFRTLSVAAVPVAAQVPAGLCLYWATSSAMGLAQALALRYPHVRRACGVLPTASESRKPVRDLLKSILVRTTLFWRDVAAKNKE